MVLMDHMCLRAMSCRMRTLKSDRPEEQDGYRRAKCAPLMVRQGSPESIEGLTTNENNMLPFFLSLSKDLFSVSLTDFELDYI